MNITPIRGPGLCRVRFFFALALLLGASASRAAAQPLKLEVTPSASTIARNESFVLAYRLVNTTREKIDLKVSRWCPGEHWTVDVHALELAQPSKCRATGENKISLLAGGLYTGEVQFRAGATAPAGSLNATFIFTPIEPAAPISAAPVALTIADRAVPPPTPTKKPAGKKRF